MSIDRHVPKTPYDKSYHLEMDAVLQRILAKLGHRCNS